MTYCQKGRELLLDLSRSDWLPAYDEEGVRVVLSEIGDIADRLFEAMQTPKPYPDPIKVSIFYYTQCLERNKRYMQAYLTHRLEKIRALCWETGTVFPEHLRADTLSAAEHDYFNNYNALLAEYNDSIGVDLASDMEPPSDLLLLVRVIKESGEVMTETGPVALNIGSTHYLRRTDVEKYVREGIVEHVHS